MLNGAQTPIDNLTLPTSRLPTPRRAGRAPIRPSRSGITPPPTSCRAMAPLRSTSTSAFRPTSTTTPAGPDTRLHLVYRYNSIPIGPISSMQVRINNAFLGSTPLIPGQDTSRTTQTDVPVPVVNLRPFSNTLSFDFTFQLAQETKLRGHHAHQPARRHPARFLPRSARLSALDAAAQSRNLLECRLPLHAPRRPERNHGGAAAHAHRAGDRDLRHPHGPLRPPDRLSRPARHRGRPRRASRRRRHRLPHHRRRRRSARLRQARHPSSRLPRQRADPGRRIRRASLSASSTTPGGSSQSNEHTESGALTAGGTPDAIIEGIESPYDMGGSRSIVAIHLKDATTFEPFIRHLPERAAVQRHLRLRLRSSRNAVSVLPRRLRRSIMWEFCRGGRN